MRFIITGMGLKAKIFISIGIYSLLGIYLVKKLNFLYYFGEEGVNLLPIDFFEIFILVIAFVTVILSIITASIIVKRNKQKVSKKVKLSVFISVFISFLILFFLLINNVHFFVPVSLILFGLMLLLLNRIQTEKYALLAYAEIAFGISVFFLMVNNFLLLGLGFGIFPIIFGFINMQRTRS